MYIVGINGSSKKDGNTAFLLQKGLEQARALGAKTDLIHAAEVLKGLPVPFCTDCSAPCKGICLVNTPAQKTLEILRKADGLIIGSPVYFGTVSAQLKAFWDKLRCLRGEKKLLNTVGGAVAVGASRYGGQEGTIRAIHEMMLVQGMTIVGDGHIDHDGGHYGVGAQRPAREDEQAVDRMLIMVKRVCEVAQATKKIRG